MNRPLASSLLRRLRNVLDASTQLGNALFLPSPFNTNANESISGRCHREAVLEGKGGAWLVAHKTIDWFFEIGGQTEHCFGAYMTDLARGDEYRERHERYMTNDSQQHVS